MTYKDYVELFRSQDYLDLQDRYKALLAIQEEVQHVEFDNMLVSFSDMLKALRDVLDERESM